MSVYIAAAVLAGGIFINLGVSAQVSALTLPGAQSENFAQVLPPQRDDEVDPNYGRTGGSGDEASKPKTSILPDDLDVMGLLIMTVWIMTAGVGVLAVGGIVWGAILYTTAGGNQEKTKKAIEIIRNVVIGLLLYVFMFAIVNFLIPGGVIQ